MSDEVQNHRTKIYLRFPIILVFTGKILLVLNPKWLIGGSTQPNNWEYFFLFLRQSVFWSFTFDPHITYSVNSILAYLYLSTCVFTKYVSNFFLLLQHEFFTRISWKRRCMKSMNASSETILFNYGSLRAFMKVTFTVQNPPKPK